MVLASAIGGCADAIGIIVNLSAGYLLFCGFLSIVDALGAARQLGRMLSPVTKRLMPAHRGAEAAKAIAMNLSANLLGLGNAATPTGVEAMRLMEKESEAAPEVRHDMSMLMILNATSIQLIPTTVLTLRVAAGSADPNRVLVPSLICTVASTAVGVALGLVCRARALRAARRGRGAKDA